ncbi:CTB family bacteriocin [Nostoc sp. CENA67]|uniref:CTB family bacteriocin n=1 Tax=Amazonocrinis nigriterrae CENA67 TaxID=2794033 RepID=A0A8J7HSW0_9NOST|nr:CTB family bacteriocin [Amazonocrinis nigriterrae]MBH8562907.1 CTB family bacteriocin [Amazonocrinis nigriterrae CENA67]
MSHNLFIDVTEEQQEIVAGGVEGITLSTLYNHLYQLSETIGPVAASSGPSGSTIVSGGIQKTIQEVLQTSSIFSALVG